jgi:hypothetical protein
VHHCCACALAHASKNVEINMAKRRKCRIASPSECTASCSLNTGPCGKFHPLFAVRQDYEILSRNSIRYFPVSTSTSRKGAIFRPQR